MIGDATCNSTVRSGCDQKPPAIAWPAPNEASPRPDDLRGPGRSRQGTQHRRVRRRDPPRHHHVRLHPPTDPGPRRRRPVSVAFNSATDPVYISDTAAGQMTRISARSRRRRDALVCEVRCTQPGGAFKNAVHAARPAASAHQQISGRLMDACMPYSLLARICLICASKEPRSGGA